MREGRRTNVSHHIDEYHCPVFDELQFPDRGAKTKYSSPSTRPSLDYGTELAGY